jgi:Family of unknown function (DUF5681)
MHKKQRTEYDVGYGKPPAHTRFKKGQSGNGKGRPKKSKSFVALLADALEERVVVQEGGRRRSMTKRQALAKQFANKGAMGDLKAAKMVLELVSHIDDHKTEQLEERQREAEASRERVLRKLDLIRERINARVADLVAEVDKKDKQ